MSTTLTNSQKIHINKPSITEKEISYVNDAITNGWGEKCYDYIYRFEKSFAAYTGTQFAMATSSCTAAIHLALLAMGLKAGDEVIVPDITWVATAAPVLYIGAKPVFTDVLEHNWCLDPKKIEAAITPKTKGIIAVHVYGNMCDMDAIMAIAKKHNLFVLEDAAEALGSEYKGKRAGSIGHVGVFSFHGTKTMTTGEGGMLVTNDATINEQARILNDHGRNPKDPEAKMFWMRNYGYKYKISNLQAALGCAQIERMDELIDKKREIAGWYKELLIGIPCVLSSDSPDVKNGFWMPTVVFDKSLNLDREGLFKYFKQLNIDSRPFFFPLSSLPMFEKQPQNTVSYDIYSRGINLPSYHELTYEEAKKVIDSFKEFLSQSK